MNRLVDVEFPTKGKDTFIIEGELIEREDHMEFLDISSAKFMAYLDEYKFLFSMPMVYVIRSTEKFQVILQEELSPLKFWVTRTK